MGDLIKKDISSEEYRIYHFDDYDVTITKPKTLYINKSGSHRVVDEDGVATYIRKEWRYITWKAAPEVEF